MKASECMIVAIGYVLSFVVAAFIVYRIRVLGPGLALVVSAIVGTQIAAWLYHKRRDNLASYRTRAAVGSELSVLAVLTGTSSQAILKWMTFPEITLSIGTIGSFIFPFVIFGPMQRAFDRSKDKSPNIKAN